MPGIQSKLKFVCNRSYIQFKQLFNNNKVESFSRKLGIGKMLVLKVRDYARAIGCIKIKLTTYKSMNAAMSLYQSLGFRIVKEVKLIY